MDIKAVSYDIYEGAPITILSRDINENRKEKCCRVSPIVLDF